MQIRLRSAREVEIYKARWVLRRRMWWRRRGSWC